MNCLYMYPDQDEGCGNAKGQMKAGFLLNNSDFMFNPSQVAHSYSMVGWVVDHGTLFVGYAVKLMLLLSF